MGVNIRTIDFIGAFDNIGPVFCNIDINNMKFLFLASVIHELFGGDQPRIGKIISHRTFH